MRTCKLCDAAPHPDDVHFCTKCGAFLDWDPPDEPAGGGLGDPAAAATSVVTAPEHVSVRLFLPDQPIEPDAVATTVAAGGSTLLMARIRNQSDIVDSYHLALEGLPEGWYTIDAPTVYLLSHDAREAFEEDVPIAIHPPRSSAAVAARWTVTVVATSHAHPTRVARARASVDIEPFWEMAAVARPAVVTGRRRRAFDGQVHNTGNAEVPVVVAATDAEDRCRFELPADPVRIPPGANRGLPVAVRPKRPHWIGRTIDHRLELVARTADDQELAAPFNAVFRQKPWIAWWIPLLLLLLLIVALVIYLLWPDTAKVPDVVKQPSAFAAQKELEEEGLTLNPKVETRVQKGAKPGSVIDQAPDAGERVDEGKAVAVVVAAGGGRVKVPKLKGLKVANADERLQKAGLTLGAVKPDLDPEGKVGTQVPKAGAVRRRGSPVNVVLAPAKKAGGKKEKKAAAAEEVPVVAGGSTAAAAAALKKAGLEPVLEYRIDPAKRDTVLGTLPAPGEPPPEDGKVVLIVSAGFPRLALDTGVNAFAVGGVTGRPVVGISRDASVTSGGAWSPDGLKVAFVRGGKLFLRSPKSAARAHRITLGSGFAAEHAAFAPHLKRRVLAFVDGGGGADGGDAVCWLDVTGAASSPTCLPLTRWNVEGLAWAPDGKLMLASVVSGSKRGLLRLVSSLPFSSEAVQWRAGRKIATRTDDAVRAAAFAPDGVRLAVVTRRGGYKVALVKPDDLRLEHPDVLLAGCDVAWRSDGRELAVVQGSGTCGNPVGRIVRVSPGNPGATRRVARRGRHPSWQPIDLTPAPER